MSAPPISTRITSSSRWTAGSSTSSSRSTEVSRIWSPSASCPIWPWAISTPSEKALYWKQDDLYVYGGLSGRLDHTLANLQLFAKFSERGAYVTGIGEDFAVRALTGPDVYDLPALDEGIVSVIALNDRVEGVIETGLLYSMDDEPLTSRVSRGISNEFIGQPATIGVERGTVLVFHPLP